MSISTELIDIHSKVTQLCSLCEIKTSPLIASSSHKDVSHKIINDLNKGINFINTLKEVQSMYNKLEESIQKKQADIRRHIGNQQQLKLYSESLEQQLDDSQYARSEFIEKSRKMISDLKRNNHFLHQQNVQLKEQIALIFQDDQMRKRTVNIDADLKKHMRTESSRDQFQKTPSKHKFSQYSNNKKSQLIKTKLDMRQLLSSVQRKRQIQKKIKQLNDKRTLDEVKPQKLNSNSSYHQLYHRNIETQKNSIPKKIQPQPRSSVRKNNNSSKKSNGGQQQISVHERIHYKTRSIHRQT